jgi:hypothetical protein
MLVDGPEPCGHPSGLHAALFFGLAFAFGQGFAEFFCLEFQDRCLLLAGLLHLRELGCLLLADLLHRFKLAGLNFEHFSLVADLLGLLAERQDREDGGDDSADEQSPCRDITPVREAHGPEPTRRLTAGSCCWLVGFRACADPLVDLGCGLLKLGVLAETACIAEIAVVEVPVAVGEPDDGRRVAGLPRHCRVARVADLAILRDGPVESPARAGDAVTR